MNIQSINLRKIFIFIFGLSILTTSISAGADQRNLDALDARTNMRTPLTHGFWFPKLVAFGEEWYRGRLLPQGTHNETGELPDASDPDGHLGFTAINTTRWLISHHWFGEDDIAEAQLYSRNPDWFFDPVNPSNSVMGVFAMFRWGLLNEVEARLAIHNMINSYTDREYSILRDGLWLYAMANLSSTDFTVNNGTRTVPNPLGFSDKDAIRNEISVIIIHHFFGRNRNNTVRVMNKIYDRLVRILIRLNEGTKTEEQARWAIAKLVRGKKRY